VYGFSIRSAFWTVDANAFADSAGISFSNSNREHAGNEHARCFRFTGGASLTQRDGANAG